MLSPRCRSSCCRRAALKPTRCRLSSLAPTTTSPSRSVRKSSWRASASRCDERCRGGAATGKLKAGDLTIDYDRRRVLRGHEEIRLTPKEFELLSLLARNADRVLTHRAILKAIWGGNAVDQPEHLWVLIGQLRKKIEPDAGNPRYLVSEPWVGYRFATEHDD